MSQVTIYLEEDTLAAAKAAAARAQMSVSKWFAQFAEAEKAKARPGSLAEALADIDRQYGPPGDELDFLLDPKTRYAGLGEDAPREPFE
ncbi:hypothetical protein AAFF27_17550 [Xylophilus sp. GW821-FHT01B05]